MVLGWDLKNNQGLFRQITTLIPSSFLLPVHRAMQIAALGVKRSVESFVREFRRR